MNNFQEKSFQSLENDVKLYYCGKRLHNFGHHYGPYTQEKYLIYFIKEGKARLKYNKKEMDIYSTGLFVNFPNSQTSYECYMGVPWSIKWISVNGDIIEKYLTYIGVSRENPFLPLKDTKNIESVFDEMYELFDKGTISSKLLCVSLVHKLFALLYESKNTLLTENDYVSKANALIDKHYGNASLCVSEISNLIGLNANYFSVLYKKTTGVSPIKAINDKRFEEACKMLKFTNKAIKDVSISCGFADELYFSRAFKKVFGVPPTIYRKKEELLT